MPLQFVAQGPMLISSAVTPVTLDSVSGIGFNSSTFTFPVTINSGDTLLLVSCFGFGAGAITVTVDPAGSAIDVPEYSSQFTSLGTYRLTLQALIIPGSGLTPGTYSLQFACGSSRFGGGAVTFKNTNLTLATAIPSGSIIKSTPVGGATVSHWGLTTNPGTLSPPGEPFTAPANCMAVYNTVAVNNTSSAVTFSANTTMNSGSGGLNLGVYAYSGTDFLTVHPAPNDNCAGLACVISP